VDATGRSAQGLFLIRSWVLEPLYELQGIWEEALLV